MVTLEDLMYTDANTLFRSGAFDIEKTDSNKTGRIHTLLDTLITQLDAYAQFDLSEIGTEGLSYVDSQLQYRLDEVEKIVAIADYVHSPNQNETGQFITDRYHRFVDHAKTMQSVVREEVVQRDSLELVVDRKESFFSRAKDLLSSVSSFNPSAVMRRATAAATFFGLIAVGEQNVDNYTGVRLLEDNTQSGYHLFSTGHGASARVFSGLDYQMGADQLRVHTDNHNPNGKVSYLFHPADGVPISFINVGFRDLPSAMQAAIQDRIPQSMDMVRKGLGVDTFPQVDGGSIEKKSINDNYQEWVDGNQHLVHFEGQYWWMPDKTKELQIPFSSVDELHPLYQKRMSAQFLETIAKDAAPKKIEVGITEAGTWFVPGAPLIPMYPSAKEKKEQSVPVEVQYDPQDTSLNLVPITPKELSSPQAEKAPTYQAEISLAEGPKLEVQYKTKCGRYMSTFFSRITGMFRKGPADPIQELEYDTAAAQMANAVRVSSLRSSPSEVLSGSPRGAQRLVEIAAASYHRNSSQATRIAYASR